MNPQMCVLIYAIRYLEIYILDFINFNKFIFKRDKPPTVWLLKEWIVERTAKVKINITIYDMFNTE